MAKKAGTDARRLWPCRQCGGHGRVTLEQGHSVWIKIKGEVRIKSSGGVYEDGTVYANQTGVNKETSRAEPS